MKLKEVFKLTGIPVVVASLCCLSPVIIVLLGLGTVTFAGSLADTLYGDYKWVFRIVGLVLVLLSLGYYFWKKQGICTFGQVKRRRNEIINTVVLVIASAVVGYVIFLYVIIEYIGIFLKIWK